MYYTYVTQEKKKKWTLRGRCNFYLEKKKKKKSSSRKYDTRVVDHVKEFDEANELWRASVAWFRSSESFRRGGGDHAEAQEEIIVQGAWNIQLLKIEETFSKDETASPSTNALGVGRRF